MEVLQTFGLWDQEIESWFTNHKPLILLWDQKFQNIFDDFIHYFEPIQYKHINYQHMKDLKKVIKNFQKLLILFVSDPERLLPNQVLDEKKFLKQYAE